MADAAPGAAQDLPVVNIMPAFLDAWSQGVCKPTSERVRLMQELVFEPNPEAFNTPQFQLDEVHVAWYLHDVAPLVPAIASMSAALQRNLPTYERAFFTAFPDFTTHAKIFFQPSLLNFDGQTRPGIMRSGWTAS